MRSWLRVLLDFNCLGGLHCVQVSELMTSPTPQVSVCASEVWLEALELLEAPVTVDELERVLWRAGLESMTGSMDRNAFCHGQVWIE